MEKRIIDRIEAIKKLKAELIAQVNACNGAIGELENLLKKEEPKTENTGG